MLEIYELQGKEYCCALYTTTYAWLYEIVFSWTDFIVKSHQVHYNTMLDTAKNWQGLYIEHANACLLWLLWMSKGNWSYYNEISLYISLTLFLWGSSMIFLWPGHAHVHQQTGLSLVQLTHWGRVTYKCVSKLTIIGSNNGLSPGRRQAIIWTNAGFLLIWPLGTNFSEISIEIQTFSFKKMHFKMSSGKWRPFVSASMC